MLCEAVSRRLWIHACVMSMAEHGGGVLGGGTQAARKTSQRREYLS